MNDPDAEPRPEPGEGGERDRWRLARIVAALLVVTFLVGYAGAALWMRAGAPTRSVVTMPNLAGLSEVQARQTLSRLDLELEPMDSLPNPDVEAGHVLTQSPLPGQEVAPGTGVQVILSSGQVRYPVPDVIGLTRERAMQVLAASGMAAEVVEVEDMARAGLVVGVQPTPGTAVPVPARLSVRVSSGPPLVEVPDLLGLREEELEGALTVARLEVGEVSRELRLMLDEGEVVGQEPAPGDSLPAGSGVDVVVATNRIEMTVPEDIFR